MEARNQIISKITNIYDENHNEIKIENIKLEFTKSKYSSTKENLWHIILNSLALSRKNKYYIKYSCVTCDANHLVGTIQFLRKINKCSYCCYLCRNLEINKRKNHSEFLKNNKYPKNEEDLAKELVEKLEETKLNIIERKNELFNDMDDDFKTKYFLFHLTNDDYNRISKNIISFQNGKYTDLNSIKYIPVSKCGNQMQYTSIMYDSKNDILFKAHQPIMKCDNCNNNWRAKSLEQFKNTIKIMCNECLLVNKTFKIRVTKNINNEQILYQSKLELKFINWCNDNNIIVKNGPKVKYNFGDKDRIYKVDFQINKTLIEIKDDHIWHKNDLLSGKWKAKETGVYKLIENKEYDEYFIIKPNNWMNKLNYLNKLNKI